MSADAEQLIRYFVSSPWIVILLALVCLLTGLFVRSIVRKRRAKARAIRHRRYWREKFESELPQILNRNRQLQALPAPAPIPLLDFDAAGQNAAFVLSGEVIGAQEFESENFYEDEEDFAHDYNHHEYSLNKPAPNVDIDNSDVKNGDTEGHLAVDWVSAR